MSRPPDYFRAAAVALLASTAAHAHDGHHHGAMVDTAGGGGAPVFLAGTAKPFDALMGDAMAVTDHGRAHASMNGQQEHDFVTMMIPHHQGAVDMAKALLLTTTDPAMRKMAERILAEQQIEAPRAAPQPARRTARASALRS